MALPIDHLLEAESPPPALAPAAPAAPAAPEAPVKPRIRTDIPPGTAVEERTASPLEFLLVFLLLALAVGVVWFFFLAPAPSVVEEETEQEISELVPIDPTPAPASGLPYAVVAFAAPNGTVLGPIEVGRPYQRIRQEGVWTFLSVEGSGSVWVRTYELEGTEPPPPPPPPPVVPVYIPPPQPVYVQPAVPQITCLPVVENGRTIGQACGATREQREQEAFRVLAETAPELP